MRLRKSRYSRLHRDQRLRAQEDKTSALAKAFESCGGDVPKKWEPFFNLLREHKAQDWCEAQRITEMVLRGIVVAGACAAAKSQDRERRGAYADVSCWFNAMATYAPQFARAASESQLDTKAQQIAETLAGEKSLMKCHTCGKEGHVSSTCWNNRNKNQNPNVNDKREDNRQGDLRRVQGRDRQR